MNLRPIILSASVLALVACDEGSKASSSPTASATSATPSTAAKPATTASAKPAEEKTAGIFFQVPPDGGKVFQTFHVRIEFLDGLDLKEAGDDASIVVLPIDAPLKKGEAVPDGVEAVKVAMDGEHTAKVELAKTGKQKLTVQVLDGEGKAWRPELAQTITVEAVETPGDLAVEWLEPKDGATVKSPVKMKFGVKGIEIVPAGKNPKDRTTGHHHVLIGKASFPVGKVIPTDDEHKHFGKGQTEAELELPKGKHTLALQFADGTHASYGERLATTITITVE